MMNKFGSSGNYPYMPPSSSWSPQTQAPGLQSGPDVLPLPQPSYQIHQNYFPPIPPRPSVRERLGYNIPQPNYLIPKSEPYDQGWHDTSMDDHREDIDYGHSPHIRSPSLDSDVAYDNGIPCRSDTDKGAFRRYSNSRKRTRRSNNYVKEHDDGNGLRRRLDSLQQNNFQLEARNNELEKKLRRVDCREKSLERRIHDLENNNKRLEKQRRLLETNNKSLGKRIYVLESDNKKLQTERDEGAELVRESKAANERMIECVTEKMNKEHACKLSAKDNEIVNLKEQLSKLDKQCKSRTEELRISKAAELETKRKLDKVEVALKSSSDRPVKLQHVIPDLTITQKHDRLKILYYEEKEIKDRLEKEVQELQKKLSHLVAENNEVQAKFATSQKAEEIGQCKISQLQNQIKKLPELEGQNRTLSNEKRDLENNLNKLREEKNLLEKQKNSAQSQLEKAKSAAQSITTWHAKLQNYKSQVTTLARKNHELKSALPTILDTLCNFRNALCELSNSVVLTVEKMKSENEKQLTDTGAVVKEKFGFISRKLTTTTKLAEDHKRRLTLKSQQWGENAERLKTSVSSLMERLNRCEEENGRLESLNIELNHTKVTFVQRIDGLEEKLKETNDNKTTLENSSQTERGRDGKLEREQEKYDMLESRFNDLQKTQASSGCCSNCKKIKEEVSDVQVLRIQLEQLEGEKSSLVQSNCHYLQERERLFATLRRKDEQLVEKQKELAQVQHQFAQMRSPKQSGRA